MSIDSGLDQKDRKAEVRCLECLVRIRLEDSTKEATCPKCGTRYLLYWPAPGMAKIKGVIE